MNRKILQAGPSTLAVSLPMGYVKKFRLKKGDEVSVEQLGSNLNISTKSTMQEDSAAIDISELYPFGTKIMGVMYKLGYKRIKAAYDPSAVISHRGKKVKELDMIKNTFNHLTGMQIQEVRSRKNENYVVAEQKAILSTEEFDNTFNQLFLHLITQAESCIDAITSKRNIEEEAYLIETLINQSSDFCVRVLSTSGYNDHKKTAVYFNFVSNLEEIGDRYFSILLYYHDKKDSMDNETLSMLKTILGLLREFSSIHRKFDMKKMMSAAKSASSALGKYKDHISSSRSNFYSYEAYTILLKLEEIVEIIYGLNYKEFSEG